jgi:ABC-type bacteriocin/lantibiotic exporter with double-glycine peptidase domain
VIRSRVDEFIRGGQSGISEHALAAATRLAVVDDVIAGLPKGFRTEIGTGGHLISGGQRQRLALAQAFAKNPSVVLLDEATSALDSLTEHKVFDSLAEWSKDRIVVLVTHRVMNLQRADRIYVLQDGSVIEHGNWRSLLALGGTFASMVSRQQSTAQVA